MFWKLYGHLKAIRKIQEVEARLRKPSGPLDQAVQGATEEANRYAQAITHVITGTLKKSHRIYRKSAFRREIRPDPAVINPMSGIPAAKYAPIEHARGGSHAFYARTKREHEQRIVEAGVRQFLYGMR